MPLPNGVAKFQFVRPYHLYYDGECSLCRRFAKYVSKLDKENRIACMPYQAAEAFPFGLNSDTVSTALHLVQEEGMIYSGARAVEELCAVLPGLAGVRWMVETRAGKNINERLYGFLSSIRKKTRCPRCP